MATQDDRKRAAAEAALAYIEDNDIVGVGTGSTANHFIDALARMKARIDGAVASSDATVLLVPGTFRFAVIARTAVRPACEKVSTVCSRPTMKSSMMTRPQADNVVAAS